MISNIETAQKTAEFLMQIKAIKLQPHDPFTWASGWKSPIYCDNRLSLSYPSIRTYIREEMAKAIQKNYPGVEVIAGVATGAIAIGALVAEQMGLPFVYVRSSAKSHGRQNQVEGHLESGKQVVVIEDLISTGMSSLVAVDALREQGAKVLGMIGIFTYGFQLAEDNFKNANCTLTTLSDYENLIAQAVRSGYITPADQSTLSEWRRTPDTWGK